MEPEPNSRVAESPPAPGIAELPPIGDVREGTLTPGQSLPLVIEPASKELDLVELASRHRAVIRQRLLRHGGILFRGFSDISLDTFHRLMAILSGEPVRYLERSSPRHEVGNNVYTSTDYPADQRIFLHNEQSYNVSWPLRISFHCVVPPASGGGTPLADCRKIHERISARTRMRLESRGYCYTRHFGSGFGLTWREAFQVDDRAGVERYCGLNDISYTWGPGDTLTTRQVRPVAARHPETGETTWFNHLTFFNVSTLGTQMAKALLSMGKELLPNNTYYGDGTDIEPEILDELRAAYLAETVVVPWCAGDILMLDNMLAAHGRESFTPPREIVVAMTEPCARYAIPAHD